MEYSSKAASTAQGRLRILMQNRPNAVTHPGGDTVVMERIAAGVRALGHQVEIDLEGRRNPADHDVVHLFNFATPELTETFARRAHGAGVPMVVTTLYEDWPSFYNQMSSAFSALEVYAGQGQVRAEWRSLLEEAKKAVPHAALNNSWTAQHAQVLMATGEYEVRALRRDYPAACSIETCCYGSDLAQADAAPDLFRRETGLVDFVLCVGRLERRKNQAMLLKALEDDDLPLVFAGGGFTYQQDYEALCRKFRRRGRTVFLGRLSPEMLSSAYAAARVHVLPSWFELPGLVSLEAACAGANIVVTGRGTARDYFGDYAYYCEPDDDESIRNAVLAAYYQPRRPELAAHARQFTWEASAERHSALYLAAIRAKETAERRSSRAALGTAVQQSIASSTNITNDAAQSVGKIPEILGARREITGADGQALQYCTLGDNMIKQNRYAEAEQAFRKALQCVPDLPRALRGVGVSCLTQQKVEQAETYFRQALKFEPQDVKSMLGLGAVAWARQEKQEAFSIYLRAAEVDPAHPSTILYLVNAAYELKRLPELERALQGFLNRCPDNMNIQYCLAGCCFAQMKYAKASGIVERILQIQPGNEQALELRAELEKKAAAMHGGSAEPSGGTASLVPAGSGGSEETLACRWTRAGSVGAKLQLLEEAKKEKHYEEVIHHADLLAAECCLSSAEAALAGVLKAESLGCLGRTSEAEALFGRHEGDALYGYRALCGTGALIAAGGRWEAAKDYFRRALAAKPHCDVALAGLGICSCALGSSEEAWENYRRALRSNPENVQALHGLMQLGYQLRRLPEVEEALANYLEMNPVDLPFVYSLAGCLYVQGRIDEAVEYCRKILIFEPENELALELLQKAQSREAQAASA